MNHFKQKPKELTTTELIIGAVCFIVGGIGFIFIILQAFWFIDAVFGK